MPVKTGPMLAAGKMLASKNAIRRVPHSDRKFCLKISESVPNPLRFSEIITCCISTSLCQLKPVWKASTGLALAAWTVESSCAHTHCVLNHYWQGTLHYHGILACLSSVNNFNGVEDSSVKTQQHFNITVAIQDFSDLQGVSVLWQECFIRVVDHRSVHFADKQNNLQDFKLGTPNLLPSSEVT